MWNYETAWVIKSICIPMYCDIFVSGLLFTETPKKVWIKLINVAITTGKWLKVASYCFLKSGGNANICILKKTRETGEGLLRTRISVVGLWGLWRFFKKTPREPLTSLRSARKVRTPHNASQIHALDLLHHCRNIFQKRPLTTPSHSLPKACRVSSLHF